MRRYIFTAMPSIKVKIENTLAPRGEYFLSFCIFENIKKLETAEKVKKTKPIMDILFEKLPKLKSKARRILTTLCISISFEPKIALILLLRKAFSDSTGFILKRSITTSVFNIHSFL